MPDVSKNSERASVAGAEREEDSSRTWVIFGVGNPPESFDSITLPAELR